VNILGIETSCDETAVGVVEDGVGLRSSVVASQSDLHARFGGVVPEIASRAHLELVNPVIAQALIEAGLELSDIDAVAACAGPGLAGSLLVGVSAAKAVALCCGIPYIGVNHLEGHLYAAFLEEPDLTPPLAFLLVSGGHTMIVTMEGHGRYRVLGQTIDDAAGEAFDKVARHIGLGYPGGPEIDRIGALGDHDAIKFPRPMLDEGYDFSFSGLKTAVATYVKQEPDAEVTDVAAAFQEAVVDVCITKLLRAAAEVDAKTVVIGGGVAANSRLRTRLCTDNGAMIAAAAWYRLQSDGPTPLSGGAQPGLRLPTIE
jgi:N6-L-threonylcarbamoyladenine synthase